MIPNNWTEGIKSTEILKAFLQNNLVCIPNVIYEGHTVVSIQGELMEITDLFALVFDISLNISNNDPNPSDLRTLNDSVKTIIEEVLQEKASSVANVAENIIYPERGRRAALVDPERDQAKALENAKKLKDPKERDQALVNIASKSLTIGEFDKALDIVNLIQDSKQRDQVRAEAAYKFMSQGNSERSLEMLGLIQNSDFRQSVLVDIVKTFIEKGDVKVVSGILDSLEDDHYKQLMSDVVYKFASQEKPEKVLDTANLVKNEELKYNILMNSFCKFITQGSSDCALKIANEITLKNTFITDAAQRFKHYKQPDLALAAVNLIDDPVTREITWNFIETSR